MAHDIFISFKSEDQDFAEKICDDLAKKNIKCWISSREIHSGEAHQGVITDALLDAKAMILVFSSSANQSDEILKELTIASKFKKLVIPVRIEDFFPERGPYVYELTNRQYIDLFKNWEKEIEHLAKDIQFHISKNITNGSNQQVNQSKEESSSTAVHMSKEETYLDILRMAYSDGIISPSEKDFLSRKAKDLGLTSERADELEEQIKKQSTATAEVDNVNRNQNRVMGNAFADVLNTKYEKFIKQLSKDKMFALYQARDRSSVSLVFRMDQESPVWFGFVVSFGNDFYLEFEDKQDSEKIDYAALDVFCNNEKSRSIIKEWLDKNCKDIFPDMYITGNKLILLTKKEFKTGTPFEERKKAFEEMTINNLDILFPRLVNSFGIALSETTSSADVTKAEDSGDAVWPSAGHKFLKAVKQELDISKLPFKPAYITTDEEIEEEKSEPETDWMIDDFQYFAVWLTGRRKEKINVIWGIYSDKKRNPEFRKMSDDLYEGDYKKYLDKNGEFSIDGVYYYFETENYLGQSATERKLISEINNPDFIKHVVSNLLAFANVAWPVIEKNLVKG